MTVQRQTYSFKSRATSARPSRTHVARASAKHVHRSIVALAVLLVASCGSSGSDSSSTTTSATANGNPTEQTTTSAGGGEQEEAAGGSGLGTIEIGDVRHELTITRCLNMFGAIGGDGVSVSEPDNVDVSFSFSPEDWAERDESEGWTEKGTVRLDSDDPYLQWESGQSLLEMYNLPDGVELTKLDITSYDIADDGQSVTGEAIFMELTSMMSGTGTEPIAGTFSFSCPPQS